MEKHTCKFCHQVKEMSEPCPLEGASLGDWVIYQPYKTATPEDGVITGWSKDTVFVLYSGKLSPQATNARDLRKG